MNIKEVGAIPGVCRKKENFVLILAPFAKPMPMNFVPSRIKFGY
jgi:hypothetical protein